MSHTHPNTCRDELLKASCHNSGGGGCSSSTIWEPSDVQSCYIIYVKSIIGSLDISTRLCDNKGRKGWVGSRVISKTMPFLYLVVPGRNVK